MVRVVAGCLRAGQRMTTTLSIIELGFAVFTTGAAAIAHRVIEPRLKNLKQQNEIDRILTTIERTR